MLIMAIDPNTKTGITEGEPGRTPTITTQVFRRDETDDVTDIYGRVVFHFAERLRTNVPDLIAIEAPVPPSSLQGATTFNTTLITIGVFSIITGIAKCKSIPVRKVAAASWRKSFLGSGRMPGDVAKREAMKLCERLGWHADDHNGAESAGIWFYACAQVAPAGLRTMKPHLFAERADA